eukprot:353588-Chlamydomonas_euryale.AAC.6
MTCEEWGTGRNTAPCTTSQLEIPLSISRPHDARLGGRPATPSSVTEAVALSVLPVAIHLHFAAQAFSMSGDATPLVRAQLADMLVHNHAPHLLSMDETACETDAAPQDRQREHAGTRHACARQRPQAHLARTAREVDAAAALLRGRSAEARVDTGTVAAAAAARSKSARILLVFAVPSAHRRARSSRKQRTPARLGGTGPVGLPERRRAASVWRRRQALSTATRWKSRAGRASCRCRRLSSDCGRAPPRSNSEM